MRDIIHLEISLISPSLVWCSYMTRIMLHRYKSIVMPGLYRPSYESWILLLKIMVTLYNNPGMYSGANEGLNAVQVKTASYSLSTAAGV